MPGHGRPCMVLLGLLGLLCLFCATGCSLLAPPTLHVKYLSKVLVPNGMIESDVWPQVPMLKVKVHRGQGKEKDTRVVKLQAIHDGRAISFLVQWDDDTETFQRQAWVWNEQKHDYVFERNQVDQFAFMWPLTQGANFDMLSGQSAAYDVWQWRAGWTDISGFADDRLLIVKAHPKATRPDPSLGPLYPSTNGRKKVEILWQDDSGQPGTKPTAKPAVPMKSRLPGAEPGEATGSAADVLATGIYVPRLHKGINDKEYRFEKGNFWFIEFYRLLVTANNNEDYQLRGQGPHPFAIALWDNESGADHYTSAPLRLVMEKMR